MHVVVAHSSAGEIDLGDRPRRGNDERACSRGIDRERWNREALDGALRVDRLKPGGYVGKRDRALVAGAVHQEQPRWADAADGREQESETFVRPGVRDKRPLDRLTRDDSALERIDDDEGMTPRTPLDEDENAPFRWPGEGGDSRLLRRAGEVARERQDLVETHSADVDDANFERRGARQGD